MSLTYGMIADRLSDLVNELTDYNNEIEDFHRSSEMARVIGLLDSAREYCDTLSMGTTPGANWPELIESLRRWTETPTGVCA